MGGGLTRKIWATRHMLQVGRRRPTQWLLCLIDRWGKTSTRSNKVAPTLGDNASAGVFSPTQSQRHVSGKKLLTRKLPPLEIEPARPFFRGQMRDS
ncbi:hypothetical protein DP117_12720 [Brasilonema sp. UFV-L1]|nr:hypothetical protein [Brasilonema sp. UFV-L1]